MLTLRDAVSVQSIRDEEVIKIPALAGTQCLDRSWKALNFESLPTEEEFAQRSIHGVL